MIRYTVPALRPASPYFGFGQKQPTGKVTDLGSTAADREERAQWPTIFVFYSHNNLARRDGGDLSTGGYHHLPLPSTHNGKKDSEHQ